jgi:hypothetical protein
MTQTQTLTDAEKVAILNRIDDPALCEVIVGVDEDGFIYCWHYESDPFSLTCEYHNRRRW